MIAVSTMTYTAATDVAYAIEHGLTAVLGLTLLILLAVSTRRFGMRQFEHRSGRRLLWLAGVVVVGLIVGL